MLLTRSGLRTLAAKIRSLFTKNAPNSHLYLFGEQPHDGFDPRNYQDSSGTTPATIDGPCGLVLDAAGSVGSELVTNWDFSSATGWTASSPRWSITSGKAVATGSLNNENIYQTSDLEQNKTYVVTVDCTSYTAGSFFALLTDGVLVGGTPATGVGKKQWIVKTGPIIGSTVCLSTGSTLTAEFDSFSIKEITGLHASQATPGNKPTERRGIVNELTWSNDLSNAAWAKTNATISGSKIVETTANGAHAIAENIASVSGQAYTIAVEATAAERIYLGVYAGSPGQGEIFNLSNGTAFGNLVAAPTSYSIAQTSSGSYVCVINYTATGATTAPSVYVCNDSGAFSYVGDAAKGINVARIGLFQGTLTAAQILAYGGIPLTTTAAASSSLGPRYLEYKTASAHRLAVGNLDINQGDFSIVTSLSFRSLGSYVIYGEDVGGLQFYIDAAGSIYLAKRGTAGVLATAAGLQTNVTYVISIRRVGNNFVLRKNSVQIDTATNAIVFTATTAGSIGSDVGGANPSDMALYSFLPEKGTFTDAEVSLMEQQAARIAGGRLVSGSFVSDY